MNIALHIICNCNPTHRHLSLNGLRVSIHRHTHNLHMLHQVPSRMFYMNGFEILIYALSHVKKEKINKNSFHT